MSSECDRPQECSFNGSPLIRYRSLSPPPKLVERSDPLPLTLRTAVMYATKDPKRRECAWYGVWSIVLQECMFVTPTNQILYAFNTIPHHSPSVHIDTDLPDLDLSSEEAHPMSPVFYHSTGSPVSTASVVLQVANLRHVPDFVQLLHHLATEGKEVSHTRTLLILEVKPPNYQSLGFESLWKYQVQDQVVLAFHSDPSLQQLGVMMALGAVWRFGLVSRPSQELLANMTASRKRDSTFRPPGAPDPLNLPDNLRLPRFPRFLRSFTNNFQFQLGAPGDRSMEAFQAIVQELGPYSVPG